MCIRDSLKGETGLSGAADCLIHHRDIRLIKRFVGVADAGNGAADAILDACLLYTSVQVGVALDRAGQPDVWIFVGFRHLRPGPAACLLYTSRCV